MRIVSCLAILACVAAISPAWAADPSAIPALAEQDGGFRTPEGEAKGGGSEGGPTGSPDGSRGSLLSGTGQGSRLLDGTLVASNEVAPVLVAQAAGSAGAPPPVTLGASPWIFRTTLYAWVPFATSDSTISSLPSSNSGWPKTDVSLTNIYAGAGEFELSKGDWGAFVNVAGASLGFKGVVLREHPLTPTRADRSGYLFASTVNGQYGLSYRVLGPPLDLTTWARAPQPIALDLLAGAQTFYYAASVSTQRVSGAVSTTLTSPIVATRFNWDMTPRWNLGLGGSLGGFGVSDTSLTWQANLTVAYRFLMGSVPGAVSLGFRVQGVNFETGSGTNYLKVSETLYGPLLGFSIFF